MNKNSYSSIKLDRGVWHVQHCTPSWSDYSLGYNEMPQKKEKTMEHYKEYPYKVDWQTFKTLDEATKFARKLVMNSKEDVVIQQNISVVKFPVPDYEVETLSV